MKNTIIALVFCSALALAALTQAAQLPASPSVENELSARASNVSEITLDKDKLKLASSFMNGHGDAATSKLIEGLEGIYIRDYEFNKEGDYSANQVEQLRKYYETGGWTPVVRDQDRKTGELSEIMVKLVNDKPGGLFILDVEPKEISIVLILGPVGMEAMSKLGNIISFATMSQAKAVPQSNNNR